MTAQQAPADDLARLGRVLGHVFADPDLLVQAVSHPSLLGLARNAARGYERLEFLGDRVLGLVVAEWLLERFPDEAEGAIARRHTALVRAESLALVAEAIDLGAHLRLSAGEGGAEMRPTPNVLADACEAVIGALYIDGGLEAARRFIRARWADLLAGDAAPPQDPKTALQEWAMARGRGLPEYTLLGRTGPDHAPAFQVKVAVAGLGEATGEGPSKRAAEKAAAAALLPGTMRA